MPCKNLPTAHSQGGGRRGLLHSSFIVIIIMPFALTCSNGNAFCSPPTYGRRPSTLPVKKKEQERASELYPPLSCFSNFALPLKLHIEATRLPNQAKHYHSTPSSIPPSDVFYGVSGTLVLTLANWKFSGGWSFLSLSFGEILVTPTNW